MPSSLHTWLDRLQSHTLPAMPQTVRRVQKLMTQASTTHADYQRIVARDPGFALSIFRYLGALPKPPREPITHLSHAISLAGLAPLQAATESVPTLQKSASGSPVSGLRRSYARAVHAAFYASDWGRRRGDANPDELMLAALLNECGELALWSLDARQMQTVEKKIAQGLGRDNAALGVLGFTLPQLTSALAETWHLPPLVQLSQSIEGAFQSRSLGIMLASELARGSAACWECDDTLALIDLGAEYCKGSMASEIAQTHRSAVEVARQLQGLPLPTTAPSLLGLRGDTEAAVEGEKPDTRPLPAAPVADEGADITLRRKEPVLVQPAAPAPGETRDSSLEQPAQTCNEETREAPPSQPRTRAVQERKSSATQPVLPPAAARADGMQAKTLDYRQLQTELTSVFKQLRSETRLERILFAMQTPDRKTLRARFVTGADKDAPLRRFKVELNTRSLFTALLAKPQSFWFNTDNRDKYLSAIPQELHQTINLQGFFAGALHFDGGPLGILYADAPAALGQDEFLCFRTCCKRVGSVLDNSSPPVEGSAVG